MSKQRQLTDAEARERERVAALIAQDQRDRHERDTALMDLDGERRLIRPTPLIAARRAIAANGHSEAECTDTIGKLWSWGLLDGDRFAPDLLRDAGRRYAAAYWFRFGNVCAHIGAYADMIRGSGGPKKTFIADPEADVLVEERFRRRDQALRDVRAKREVDWVCVDGAGDNDPGWLIELMLGYPAHTRERRFEIEDWQGRMAATKDTVEVLRCEQRIDTAKRKLAREINMLRVDHVPHRVVMTIRCGLSELADIDRKEGLHRPKRPKKSEEGD